MENLDSKTVVMCDFVEKQKLEEARLLKICLGSYLLIPDIFNYLENYRTRKRYDIHFRDDK